LVAADRDASPALDQEGKRGQQDLEPPSVSRHVRVVSGNVEIAAHEDGASRYVAEILQGWHPKGAV
jgi:hypothetical protein